MRIGVTFLLFMALIPLTGFTQASDTTLNALLSRGRFSAHARSFFMATVNKGELTDYYALAAGAGIGYESPEYRNIRIAISGFFIYNLSSSDLSRPDPRSNMANRYEIGLFDITSPDNRKDLDRLEELYIQYRIHRSFLRAGKFILNTPFINPQDGRMRPTLEQGIWGEINEIRHVKIRAGWITHISPRSTVRWYGIGESIGIYPAGVDASGGRSQYPGNIQSKGIGIAGAELKRNGFAISLWNTFIENISNTALLQAEKDFAHGDRTIYGGIQAIRQDALAGGGNEISPQAYITPGSYANIAGGRIGLRNERIDVNANATLFSGGGRFLMPREWGRDPFYTFLPRERNEGFGSVKAFSVNAAYTPRTHDVKFAIGLGHYTLPDVRDYALNKYAMPSYAQVNADVRYQFRGFLKGTSLQFLYVYKKGTGRNYSDARNIINKTDMSNFNVVANYRFENRSETTGHDAAAALRRTNRVR